MQQHRSYALGCQIMAAIDTYENTAHETLAELPAYLEKVEQRFSRFRAESELSALNRRSGRISRVSPPLWQALADAQRAARWSDGLVTPLVLPALEAAGYDRSFAELAPQTAGQPAEAPVVDWRALQLRQNRRVWFPAAARLDLAGTLKGQLADRIVRRLAGQGPALADLGGDIAVSGPRADGSAWPIGIADPHRPAQDLELLALRRGGVATSGRDYRHWQRADQAQHHIIDPRSGRPAASDVFSVTVVAPDAATADVAAKVVLILGRRRGLNWLERQPDLAALLVMQDGVVARSRRMQALVWE